MKRILLLIFLGCMFVSTLPAASWYVSPLGTDDLQHGSTPGAGAFQTIPYAISRASSGDVILVAAGTYLTSNILVDKTLTIEGTGLTRESVVIAPAGEDGNLNAAFDPTAQNGFIIKAHGVTIRKLTINGRGNNGLTPGRNNFRAGIVTLDDSQPGGGVWNNLHIDNVLIRFTYRRGISVFPRSVSGTVVENSRVEQVAYNHGMYLAGQSQAVNNQVTHCFQGIVMSLDAETPPELNRITGNTLSQIGNFPGCFGDAGNGVFHGQPRAIEFDNTGPGFRTVEILNNVIDDLGSAGNRGTVGIYTRRANASSLISGNTIQLTSGSSWSAGGSQAVGMLLGWSYENGFVVRNNNLFANGYGMGVMIFGSGTDAHPMILEGNAIAGSSSQRLDTADGTGIYIANQYLYAPDNKQPSCVIIRNGNSINGFVRGIDVLDCPNSSFALEVTVSGNSLAENNAGIIATGLPNTVSATRNYWGGNGPRDPILNPSATGSSVSTGVTYTPWWCDNAMTSSCPILLPGKVILNTSTAVQYAAADLLTAVSAALDGHSLYIAGLLPDGLVYDQPGKTVHLEGATIAGQSVIQHSNSPLVVQEGSLSVTGLTFKVPTSNAPTVVIDGGTLKIRNCVLNESGAGDQACLLVNGGSVDAGTDTDPGLNRFLVSLPGVAVYNVPIALLPAVGNDWGHPTGPSIITNNKGLGASIAGPGLGEVIYYPFRNAPVTTIGQAGICAGETMVDIPVTVTGFTGIGQLDLTFGFTPVQMTNPILTDINPAFAGWEPFTVTTDPQMLAAGRFKVSSFGSTPTDGVNLPDGSQIFTLRFTVTGNARSAVGFIDDDGNGCVYAGVAPSHAFNDIPSTSWYVSGGMDIHARRKISGSFTYYNTANVQLTTGVTVGLYHDGLQVGSNYTVTNGNYEFSGLCPGTYELRATSDRPTYGSVNTTDAAQVNYWGPHPYPIEKVRFYAGDVTRENFLNASDAQSIQQHFVNGTPFLREPWTFWNAGTTILSNPFVPIPDYPTVTLLPGSDLTVNMYGLCTGDFNRSFNPLNKKMASATLSLDYGRSIHMEPGREFELPVRMVHPSAIGALSMVLDFPSDIAEITGIEFMGSGGIFDWALDGHELRIGWHSDTPVFFDSYSEFIVLRLKTRDSFENGRSIRLSLADDPLNELADDQFEVIPDAALLVDVVESSATGIEGHSGGHRLAAACHPNPFPGSAVISYTLPFAGDVSITLFDYTGRQVMMLPGGALAAGNHRCPVNAKGLPAGIYTAVLSVISPENISSTTLKLAISK